MMARIVTITAFAAHTSEPNLGELTVGVKPVPDHFGGKDSFIAMPDLFAAPDWQS
jgi:hypothetical protein